MGRQSRRKRGPAQAPVKDPIRFAVEAGVYASRVKGMSDPGEIRRAVLGSASEAIEGGELPTKVVARDDGDDDIWVTTPMLFRLAFERLGVDYRGDLHQQEVVFARVEKTLAEVVAG